MKEYCQKLRIGKPFREYSVAELTRILNKAKAALGKMASENTIVLRGASNSFVNANTLGATDLLGSWGYR